MKEFEPKIVSFICDWCSLQAADFVGVTRLYFPRKVKFIRVSCSGRVNPEIIAESFLNFTDGVLVMGCREGNCNYLTGNYQAERVVKAFREVMKLISVDPERLSLHLESDTEITVVYDHFYQKIKAMGPLAPEDEKSREDLRGRLLAARATLLDEDLKWLVAREWTLVARENAYGEVLPQNTFDETIRQRIREQFTISQVSRLIEEEPLSAREISQRLGIEPKEVFQAIVEMKGRGQISEIDVVNRNPRYVKVIG